MSITTIRAGSRYFGVTPTTAQSPGHPYIELGPGGTSSTGGIVVVQFNPDDLFVGNFVVMARTMGAASDAKDTPFVPVPYRVGSLNDVAQITNGQGWPWSLDPIGTSAIIRVPSDGQSIVLMNGLTAGRMDLTMWDLQGSFGL